MDNEIYSYGETKSLYKDIFTRDGYTFIGWSTTQDGAVVYSDGGNLYIYLD